MNISVSCGFDWSSQESSKFAWVANLNIVMHIKCSKCPKPLNRLIHTLNMLLIILLQHYINQKGVKQGMKQGVKQGTALAPGIY